MFVPMALKLEEAQAAFTACRFAFEQLNLVPNDHPLAGQGKEARVVYAHAMVEIAKAIDKATGNDEEQR